MSDPEVLKQFQEMVQFIKQEAQEKANEIEIMAEEELNVEKWHLVQAGIDNIKEDYEEREKALKVKQNIEYSSHQNVERLKVLQAQGDMVSAMKEAAAKELLGICQDENSYKCLLKDLIVQGLLRLKEPVIIVRCREADLLLVDSVVEEAEQEYAQKADVCVPQVVVDDKTYLPPAPNVDGEGEGFCCAGGVVLASKDGKIVCENTLDARLGLVFKQKLPEILRILSRKVSS